MVILAGMALGLAVLAGIDVRGLINHGLDYIKQAGPVVFFSAMAICPGFGVPALTFDLTVGSAFSPSLGMPWVVALSLLALSVNFILTYCLARWILRPILQRLIDMLGYRLPAAEGSDATDLLVILRLMPGVPYMVQNYMAGLASMPFPRYILISVLLVWPIHCAFIIFGDALVNGKGKVIIVAIGLLAALAAGSHLLRKHYAAKKAKA